jgi:arylsulfatase A-like enzyme
MLFLFACNQENEPVPGQPNIVIIMADDLGYGGIGSYCNDSIRTPNLDALSAGGLKFTDFYANAPVCTPTRAALMTGNYQQRAGLEGVIYVRGESRQVGLDTSQVTIAELMKAQGYATGIMGKWHLGYQAEYNPVHHGFDEFYGYVSGNIDYHSHYDNAGIYDWWHNLDTIQEEGYVTDLITEHSVEFINRHKDHPFFLYVPHEAPHVPFQGRNDPGYRYPGQEFSYYGPVEDQQRAYREMVEVMDEGIGKIMQAIRQNELEENTLVFFLSDNGAEAFGSNGGLSGQKTNLYEGGIRVPAIAYWKGRISPATSAQPAMSMDLLPTILALSEAQQSTKPAFDGVDLSGLLFQQQVLDERALFWRYRDEKAVRKQNWKLLISKEDTLLFNLEEDMYEQTDLSDSQPARVEVLDKALEQWETEMSAVEMKTR